MPRFSFLLAVLLLVGCSKATSLSGHLEFICNETCSCNTEEIQGKKEYKVICKGDPNKPAILSSKIFEDERKPSWDSQVYVRVEDTSGLFVGASFLSWWKAYYMSALDIWRAKNIVFPKTVIEKVPTDAYNQLRAGIGIRNSSFSHIPSGILGGSEILGIDFYNVSMSSLKLSNIVEDEDTALQYLRLQFVTLGSLERSDRSEAISLAGVSWGSSQQGIVFDNSKVGIIEEDSMNLISEDGSKVSFLNSHIGEIEPEGMKLSTKIQLKIEGSFINLEQSNSINLDDDDTIVVKNSTMLLPSKFLNSRNCYVNKIEGNKFILFMEEGLGHDEDITEAPEKSTERTSTTSVDVKKERKADTSKYIHQSCLDKNQILNLHTVEIVEKEVEIESSTNILATTNCENLVTAEIMSNALIFNNNTHLAIHRYVIYFVVSLLIFLLLCICILATMAACKRKSGDYDTHDRCPTEDEPTRRPSLMYMPGSQYDSSVTNEIKSFNRTLESKNYEI